MKNLLDEKGMMRRQYNITISVISKYLFTTIEATETYYRGKRDLLKRQKRPTIEAKEKGIQHNYFDMTEMPNNTITHLRMCCKSFPIVLNINRSFANFDQTLAYFEQT